VHRATVYRWIHTGELPAVRLGEGGTTLRVRADTLNAWLSPTPKESTTMPRKAKQSAHAKLDQLRQQAATERVRHRELQAEIQAAEREVERASGAIGDAYAADDERAVTSSRKAEGAALTKLEDLQHRLAGAELRIERAQLEVDTFAQERARDLLKECEQSAGTVAAELTASVHQTLNMARAYVTERTAVDHLVAAIPGATPRTDGPASTHPWEAQLRDLERAVAAAPECPPPLPRWQGLDHRRAEDTTARRLQLQRRKKRTADEEAELDRLNRELGLSLPRVEVA
jgi:excisionase family DNA binding protein